MNLYVSVLWIFLENRARWRSRKLAYIFVKIECFPWNCKKSFIIYSGRKDSFLRRSNDDSEDVREELRLSNDMLSISELGWWSPKSVICLMGSFGLAATNLRFRSISSNFSMAKCNFSVECWFFSGPTSKLSKSDDILILKPDICRNNKTIIKTAIVK